VTDRTPKDPITTAPEGRKDGTEGRRDDEGRDVNEGTRRKMEGRKEGRKKEGRKGLDW
jgi:hypothetical protein